MLVFIISTGNWKALQFLTVPKIWTATRTFATAISTYTLETEHWNIDLFFPVYPSPPLKLCSLIKNHLHSQNSKAVKANALWWPEKQMEASGLEEHCNYNSPLDLDCKECESQKYTEAEKLTLLHVKLRVLRNLSDMYCTKILWSSYPGNQIQSFPRGSQRYGY